MIAFASFDEFVAMGGHGAYVWSGYGLCLALLALNVMLPLLARRRYLNKLVRSRRREVLK
jgi:heme exporter protein D